MPTTTLTVPFVDLKAQYASIKDEIDAAIASVIGKTAFIGGPFLKEFEAAFADYCGVKHCVGVANGTDALFVALKTLGVGAGDEVITVANSFIATSEAITMTGARVVFVDINPRTYNIDVSKIQDKITSKTKAIIPVHLYGQPADIGPILEIARRHGLYVVEDCAQAHGAEYLTGSEALTGTGSEEQGARSEETPHSSLPTPHSSRRVGTFGDMAAFSFYPGKNLGAYGDGGAVVTDNDEWEAKARMLANHGRAKKYDHDFEGVNSRLDGLQAAILNAKLKHLDDWSEARRKNAYLYNEFLAPHASVLTPFEQDWARAVYHLYVIRVQDREKLQEHLKNAGVSTGIHYPIALPYLNAYNYLGHGPEDFPEALKASQEIVSLPMFPELTREQIEYACTKIADFLR